MDFCFIHVHSTRITLVLLFTLILLWDAVILVSQFSIDRPPVNKTASSRTILSFPISPPQEGTSRWNGAQLDDFLQTAGRKVRNLTVSVKDLLYLVPKPTLQDAEIYNLEAWLRLRQTILAVQPPSDPKKKLRICSYGSSSTAGAGLSHARYRWDHQFVAQLRATSSRPLREMRVVNRGHGARDTLHATFLMHSFVPANIDIIIWEFAMNDQWEARSCEDMNSAVIIWLDQIQRRWKSPPLVIFMYIWDAFVANREDKFILDTAFRCHNRLAANYDFVVGAVNLASYVRNLGLGFDTILHHFFYDSHHPNAWGHWMLGMLLWDLTTDTSRSPIVKPNDAPPPKPFFNCSDDTTEGKKRVTEILDNKYAFASWTEEQPRNPYNHRNFMGGMLYPKLITHAKNVSDSLLLTGKASAARADRKFSRVLPCCSSQGQLRFDLHYVMNKSTSAIQVDIPGLGSSEDYSQKLHMTLWDSNGMSVVDYQNLTAIIYGVRECHISKAGINIWLLLPHEAQLSQLLFCNQDPTCGQEDGTILSLMHVVLY